MVNRRKNCWRLLSFINIFESKEWCMQLLRKTNFTQIICWLLQIDFARPNSCEHQNEIQSALWSCRSLNIFKAASYNAEEKEGSFLMVINLSDKGKNIINLLNMLKLVDETTFKDERELIVYSVGPSNEFKNQFLSWKLLYLPSQHLNLLLFWKYFATWHGKCIVYGIGSAAKVRVIEQIRNKGTGSIVLQSCVDFATMASQLLPMLKLFILMKQKFNPLSQNWIHGTLFVKFQSFKLSFC